MADITLDARDLLCPFPVLKARKALAAMQTGQSLEVLATDPGAVSDFSAFCEATGNKLCESSESDRVYRFVIEKTAPVSTP